MTSPETSSPKKRKLKPNEKLLFYGDQRYACINCGRCCSVWDVPITRKEKEALEQLELPGYDLKNESGRYFESYRKGTLHLIRKQPDGRCVFLDSDNFCAIHKQYGEAKKPLACRAYPFDITSWEDGYFSAVLRCDCPAVAFYKGKRIAERHADIFKLAREIEVRRQDATAIYSDQCTVDLERVRHINQGYTKILLEDSIDLKTRFYAAIRLLEYHRNPECIDDIRNADRDFRTDALAFVQRSVELLELTLATAPPPNVNQRVTFRYLMSGFARVDEEVKNRAFLVGRVARAYTVLRFILGKGNLRSLSSDYPDTAGLDPVRLLGDVRFSEEAFGPFVRFIAAKLYALSFCGRPTLGFTFEHGMKHLALTLPISCAFAALYAKTFGKTHPDHNDFSQALMIVDHSFSRSPFFKLNHVKRMTEKLCSTYEYPSLLSLIDTESPE